MARLLALDQSSQVTGWAIFEGNKLLKHGKFSYDSSIDLWTRLFKIRHKVEELIDKNNITEVVFEDIQLQANRGNNVKTFKVLAEVFGVLSELCAERGLPQQAVLASVWKSGLGIKGADRTAQKRAAQQWVISTYGVKPTQDECDAICIGSYTLKHLGMIDDGFDWAD